jgi:transposase
MITGDNPMQIKSLRIKSYKSWAVSDSASKGALSRQKKLELFDKLRSEGCSLAIALEAISCSRATYYRWRKRYQQQGISGLEKCSSRPHQVRQAQWTKQEEQQVQHLRKRYPLWGKRKLWKVLNRDHSFRWGISTVGRIVKKLSSWGPTASSPCPSTMAT